MRLEETVNREKREALAGTREEVAGINIYKHQVVQNWSDRRTLRIGSRFWVQGSRFLSL